VHGIDYYWDSENETEQGLCPRGTRDCRRLVHLMINAPVGGEIRAPIVEAASRQCPPTRPAGREVQLRYEVICVIPEASIAL